MAETTSWKLVDTRPGEHLVEHSVRSLFTGDGTIYLVTGFFTENAYRSLRDDIKAFLDRRIDNELVVVANPTADQFSRKIVDDLRSLDVAGSVTLLRYPYGFLHAKLYLRDGPDPMVILGSANLTRGAFAYNLELGLVIEGEGRDDPEIRPFLDWVEEILALARPIRRRDLFFPTRVAMTLSNWINKGRLIPARHVFSRLTPLVLVLVGLVFLSWWI